jgi:REP element-mobilizing transposase RayT
MGLADAHSFYLSPHGPFHAVLLEQIPNLDILQLQRQESTFCIRTLPYHTEAGASLRRTAEGGCPHMGLFMPQAFYRRQLPHLQSDFKAHFVTFCTDHRWHLPGHVRSLVLDSCLHDNGQKFDLRIAVVMPDHVHMIFTPLIDYEGMEVWSLAKIMDAIKGASAHKINKTLRRKGRVWQPESFDHVLRSSESLDAKIQYVMENPVRRNLVRSWSEYPWLWRKPLANPFKPPC